LGSLTDKVAVISGGGSGIGRATSVLLFQEGAKVVIGDIDVDSAERVASEIRKQNGEVLSVPVDVTHSDSVQGMVQEISERYGRIDILVNIVGGSRPKTVLDMTDAEWNRSIDLNLKSVFLCCRAVLPVMINQHYGKIVNFSSAQAFSGSATRASYTAAKAGIVGFTKSLALEVLGYGINVNVVAPGLVETSRIRAMFSDDDWRKLTSTRPMGRAVLPEEVARAVLFLVQDAQSSVSGQTLHVNGGALMI
jgi:NAD(P)-dependent dehydrogenase (short-subunit alcohol dehydrogenase family)